ncbi:MAG: tetratricopeptide repeat protein [Coraliomargarita sp.]
MPENKPAPNQEAIPRKAARRKRRTRAQDHQGGWSGYIFLLILVLATFSSILGSDLLWTDYDEAKRSPFTSMDSTEDALTREMLRDRHLFDSLSYFAETSTSLPQPQLHRSINLLLHLFSALLLLRLLRSLKLPGALAASVVFALHPAVVQPLFWPGYRTELFGLVVILAALNCGIRSRNWFEYLSALVLTLLACLVHKAGLYIPAILALMIYLQTGKLHLNDYNRVLPMVCVALFTGAWIQAGPAALISDPLPIYQSINHAGQNLFFFYTQALLPGQPALFYPYDSASVELRSIELSVLPFFIFLPFYAVALFKFRTGWSRGLIAGLTTFILMLIPGISSQGVNIDGSAAHESYGLYIALPALMALIIAGSRSVVEKIEFAGKGLWLIGVSLLVMIEVMLSGAFAYALGDPVRMWQLQSEQWPKQWIPKVALVNYAQGNDTLELSQGELIRTLEDLLEERPELINERRMLVRSYVAAGEKTNALREYRRILRESEPDAAFLQEAADYFDRMGMDWEANNARKRMKHSPTP